MNTDRLKDYGVLGIAGFCLLLATAANAAPPAKIAVCHVPPGNPANIQLIQVGTKGGALDAHLSHGDYLVSEEMCDAIADNNCDGIPGTPAEDDADCEAQLGAGATCESGVCEQPPVECPCDFSAVSMTQANWPTPSKLPGFSGQGTCEIRDPVPPPVTVIDTLIGTAFGAGPDQRICNVVTQSTLIQSIFPLSDAEANACNAEIDAYATALDAQAGITVINVGLPCPTF